MIQRTIAYSGESEVQTLSDDVSAIIDELNKGLDPSTLPPGKLTLDKLRITAPGTGTNGYSMDQTPLQIPAGAQRTLSFGFNSPVAGVGLSSGQYFPASVYADFYVDPVGAGSATFANINSTNSPGIGTAKIVGNAYLANSVNTVTYPNQIFQVNVQAYNFDTVAHWVYVSVNVCVVNTQSSTATT